MEAMAKNEVSVMPQVLMTSFNPIEFRKTTEIYNLYWQNEEVVISKRWNTGNTEGEGLLKPEKGVKWD